MSDRKATDILLDIESMLISLNKVLVDQSFASKLLINKLTKLVDVLENNNSIVKNTAPQVSIEAVDSESFIYPTTQPLVEENPIGIRRTSRPDVYNIDAEKADNTSFLMKPESKPERNQDVKDIVFDPSNVKEPKEKKSKSRIGGISVYQRVIDSDGKSVFMANVEFYQKDELIHKTRTNGAGKWMASLATGKYKVVISKRSSNKDIKEFVQNINVDGSCSPYEVPMIKLG